MNDLFQQILSGWVGAKNENFTNHPIAKLIRTDLKENIQEILADLGGKYKVKGSAGAGNWADTPWLSILDPNICEGNQEGVYPVYLFRADGSGLYLSLGFGATDLKKKFGGTVGARGGATILAEKIRNVLPELLEWGQESIELKGNTPLSQSYEWATAGAKFYASGELPSDDELKTDLLDLMRLYKRLPPNIADIEDKLQSSEKISAVIEGIALPKPFILLAGISGTGKTRFVREQANKHQVGKKNYCLVPVRPDWHEPSDLLGYVSRIGGKPEYVSTKVLDFIIAAWRTIAPHADKNGLGELDLSSPPYWLCLDEMNLAPVEQYFADYLSVLESRRFEDGKYTCEPLLDKSVLITKDAEVRSDLGLNDDSGLWDFFLENGIPLPPNLIVAGTVNMDETTHGFSRKVIDRALTIDFGEFFPNDYSKIFGGQNKPKTFTYGMTIQITRDAINCPADSDGEKSIAFLTTVNDVLKNTPFELAYRALNELLLHVSSFTPQDDAELQAVWDDFLMTKVLPRIDGDEDKLTIVTGDSSANLLATLQDVLSEQLPAIWHKDKTRLDFFSEQFDGTAINNIPCRSRKKIQWMKARLDTNTFTSYWP